METPIIGPASSWTDLHMDWHSKETPTSFDEGTVNLYGYGINGTRTLLRTDLLKKQCHSGKYRRTTVSIFTNAMVDERRLHEHASTNGFLAIVLCKSS